MVKQVDSEGTIGQSSLLINIATRNVVCLSASDSMGQAARVLAEKRISCIVVTDEEACPQGIVTERNVLHAMQTCSPVDTPLRELMSSPVITVPESITSLDAYQLCLRDGIRHLVIVDKDKRLQGVVSETDFRLNIDLNALAGRRLVASAMSQAVFNLPPEASLQEALDLMRMRSGSCVVVVCDECPVGIVTERDVVRLYCADIAPSEVPVKQVMTAPVLTIAPDATVNEAAKRMLAAKVRHLVVVDKTGRVAGLLSEHSLTQTLALNLIDNKLIADGVFLRTLVSAIPDLIWLKDVNGVYLACNARFERLLGGLEKDIVGKTDYAFASREQADIFRETDRQAMQKNGPSLTEEWVTFADDGHRELLETLKTPMYDSQGQMIGVLGVARDITVRKGMEVQLTEQADRLRQSEEKLRSLVEAIPDPIQFKDGRGRWLESNLAARAAFGLTQRDCTGKSDLELSEIVAPDVQAALLRCHQTDELVWRAGELSRVEEVIGLPDGQKLFFDVIKKPLFAADGERAGLVIVGRDVTPLRRYQEELLEREKLFRSIFEQASDGMELIDPESLRFVEVNPAACHRLGYTHQEYLEMCLSDTLVDVDHATLMANVQQLQAKGAATFERRLRCKNGAILDTEVTARRLDVSNKRLLVRVWRDITVRKRAEQALQQSLNDYSDLVRKISVGVYKFRTHPDGGVAFDYVSPRWCELVDVTEEEVTRDPQTAFARIHPDDLESFLRTDKHSRTTSSPFAWEGRLLTKSGELRWQHIESQPTRLDNGDTLWSGIQYDVTDRRVVEETLRINASVFDNSQEAIVITDARNLITEVNPAFTHITGYSREEVLGRNPKLLSSGRQSREFYQAMWQAMQLNKLWRGEIWNRRKSGDVYAELLSVTAICDGDGKVRRYVGIFSDISHIKAHEAELRHVANFDALTGIPNRRLLGDRLQQAILHTQRNNKMLAVCYLDLDRFKQVNDQFGHDTGDQLLVSVTRRLQEVLRSGDTLARLGGDEFVVLFSDLGHEHESLQLLNRVLETVARPVTIGHLEIKVSASLGVTFYPADMEDGDTLLRHADQSMYVAKQTGKNRYHLYDPAKDQHQRSQHEARHRIMQGLACNEFELFYQPMIELVSGRVYGVEALIRWHHPERGLLQPADFLRDIENSDVELTLGEWVMDHALAQVQAWHQQGMALEISINISARHLQSATFIAELARRLARYPHLPRNTIQIEVLETVALEDIAQSAGTIDACRELGVKFALDDFGTGYSSLAYLRKLSAETLKIDQSFVRGMLVNEGDRAIVLGIIALANSFGRKIVAEGIEQPELIPALLDAGCLYGQGYCIARPMPAEDFLHWYQRQE
jgi:diguanylate cyclase (GGDEF)-like protein/PAS domain S-box-containing protein